MSEVLKQKIRRDLSRWSRKLLVCVGLETIGKQLVGEESWEALYPVEADWERDTTPVSDFDPTQVPDQEFTYEDPSPQIELDPSTPATPEEEPNEEKNDFLEHFFHLLPYWYFINRAFGVPGVGAGNVASEDLSNNTHPLFEAFDAQRLNSFLLLQSLKQQQLQIQSGSSNGLEIPFNNHVQNLPYLSLDPHELANGDSSRNQFQSEADFTQGHAGPLIFPGLSATLSPQDDYLDQPLDLTQKNKNMENSNVVREHGSSLGGPDFLRNGKYVQRAQKSKYKAVQRSGRGYTTTELDAALQDIQSGKLGTRRAAVIYGIPRSTLRNKVYKLGKDRSRPYYGLKGTRRGVEDESEAEGTPVCRKNVHRQVLECGESAHRLSHDGGEGLEGEDTEEEEVKSDGISHEKKVLKEWLRTKISRQNLAQSKPSKEGPESPPGGRASLTDCTEDENSDEGKSKEARQDLILKVPSFLNGQPSGKRPELRRKINLRSHKAGSSAFPLSQSYALSRPSSTITSPTDGGGTWKRTRVEESDNESDLGLSNGTGNEVNVHDMLNIKKEGSDPTSLVLPYMLDEKKSRPKRGKYRNYDRDALVKAVKAVQNGEMSVHRAGSFFGVPHSTLEYKVKERHLLRRPKKKGVTSPKSSQKSSPENSLSGSEPSRSTTGVSTADVMSLTPSARESLNRLLSVGTFHSPSSADSTPLKMRVSGKRVTVEHNATSDNHRAHDGTPCVNVFHIGDLIRHNLDSSSLLDLTKRS